VKIIVGVTGASGVEMSYYLLKALHSIEGCEIHLIVSEGGTRNWGFEMDRPLADLLTLAHIVHDVNDMAAAISSGSFVTAGMIVMPCSMKTLAGIASGYADNLILRAVDVCLKENRRVVLVPRETPLGKVHLRNLSTTADLGCSIVPPMLTFYNGPKTIDDQINHIVGKVLMQFGISHDKLVPWKGSAR
jgi:4-hydroxy-3-polyprenylbenzoate decarboxylase